MSFVVVVTAIVIASLWVLDQLDVVPVARMRTVLANAALFVVVAAMYLEPAAYQNGMDWLIERKSNDMLEQIQPVLDELIQPATADTVTGP